MVKTKMRELELSLREKILQAAVLEFGDKGYEGARMDEIAKASGASKQVCYHHFKSKEDLFAQALKAAYQAFRGTDEELQKKVKNIDAEAALKIFVEHLFTPSIDTVRFQQLVHDENRFEGIHAAKLLEAQEAYGRLIDIIADILKRGAKEGVFREDLDPVHVYIALAGLFMFQITNAHTLSIMLGVDVISKEGAKRARDRSMDLILEAIKPAAHKSG